MSRLTIGRINLKIGPKFDRGIFKYCWRGVPVFQNDSAVFVGLFALWSIAKFATLQQRANYAAIAGAGSAVAHYGIAGLVASAV